MPSTRQPWPKLRISQGTAAAARAMPR
jgi:hypothetical protein